MYPIRLKAVLAVAAVCALAVSAGAGNAPSQPKGQAAAARAIETAFSQYKDALLQGDGPKAADVVSARTIAFYDGIATHALNTPREKLVKLDFMSRFMILRIRHEFTRSQISQMTGRELFVTGVNRGWISKSSVANSERLVDIRVASSEATASMPSARGFPAFHFLKESGQWKLDLAATFALANGAMKHEIAKSGMTEDQFIIRALSILSSREVDERVFSPPRE